MHIMKTQSISRSNLAIIYKEGSIGNCSKWKKIVESTLTEQKFNDEIEVPETLLSEALLEANEKQKGLLKEYFTFPKSIIDQTPNLGAVWEMLDVDGPEGLFIHSGKKLTKRQRHNNAANVIQEVADLLNEVWTPDFSNTSQRKYYPYLEYKGDKLGWVLCDCHYSGDYSCVPVAYYKSEEIAKHAFNLLKDWYGEYLNTY